MAALTACLLATLLATGAGLQCEVCSGPRENCEGEPRSCPPGKDSCALARTETTWGGQKNQTEHKVCLSSSECKAGSASVTFGKGKSKRTTVACCQVDGCSPDVSKVPPADTRPNSLQCRGCYAAPTEQCREEHVDCVGEEKQCIEVSSPTKAGGSATQVVMKGCATNTVCSYIKGGSGAIVGIRADPVNVKCTSASSVVSRAVRPAGLLLPALAGLLLLVLCS